MPRCSSRFLTVILKNDIGGERGVLAPEEIDLDCDAGLAIAQVEDASYEIRTFHPFRRCNSADHSSAIPLDL